MWTKFIITIFKKLYLHALTIDILVIYCRLEIKFINPWAWAIVRHVSVIKLQTKCLKNSLYIIFTFIAVNY